MSREGIYIISERGITKFNKDEKHFLDLLRGRLYAHQWKVGYQLPVGILKGCPNQNLVVPQLSEETFWVNGIIVSPEEANFTFHLFDNEPIS